MATAQLPSTVEWPQLAPRAGTVAWERAGDARLLIAAGYALVLQVSHPTVGAGVSEHSNFRRDPWGRLLRTLDYSYTMVYGGPHAAGEMGRRIRAMHGRIRGRRPDGTPYSALEPGPYAWVHATLADAIVLANARFARPLDDAQRERFWSEWRAMGRMLGIAYEELPADWAGFRAYFDEMVEHTLRRTAAVQEVLAALARPAAPPLPAPAAPAWALLRLPLGHVLGLATTGLLPPSLRARLGVRWSTAHELELRALGAGLRASTSLLPSWLLNTGPRYLRWREHGSPDRAAA